MTQNLREQTNNFKVKRRAPKCTITRINATSFTMSGSVDTLPHSMPIWGEGLSEYLTSGKQQKFEFRLNSLITHVKRPWRDITTQCSKALFFLSSSAPS